MCLGESSYVSANLTCAVLSCISLINIIDQKLADDGRIDNIYYSWCSDSDKFSLSSLQAIRWVVICNIRRAYTHIIRLTLGLNLGKAVTILYG